MQFFWLLNDPNSDSAEMPEIEKFYPEVPFQCNSKKLNNHLIKNTAHLDFTQALMRLTDFSLRH